MRRNNNNKAHCSEKLYWKYLKIAIAVTVVLGVAITWTLYREFVASTQNITERKYSMKTNADAVEKIAQKIVHIDLKGAPPKVTYYEKLFPLLSRLGATGLLIEYEDMFPYEGDTVDGIPATNAYTREEVARIVGLATESRLKIIPLIQTFGHMEYVLKLTNYSDMREVKNYPQAVCPTHERTAPLLFELIRQIMAAHPRSTEIHIGADEVHYLGVCERCFAAMNRMNWDKEQLFLDHVKRVSNFIRKNYVNVTVLMWDDEFRTMKSDLLLRNGIGRLVEPVVWQYHRDVTKALSPDVWDTYATVFPYVWIASAFKGATGSDMYVTDVTHHTDNHRSWIKTIATYSYRFKFRGIFMTGWQRYDHFSVLCELLPVGLPSLAMCLRLFTRRDALSDDDDDDDVLQQLRCDPINALTGFTSSNQKCNFPGYEIYDAAQRLKLLAQEYEYVLTDSRTRGWLNDYNVNHAFSNSKYVATVLEDLDRYRMELSQIAWDMVKAMSDVYDNHTIGEWLETFVYPLRDKLGRLNDAREKLLYAETWPRRPLDSKIEL